MTIDEYRASERREWLQKLLASEEWREVAEILEKTGPAHTATNPAITPHGAHIELGKRQGYALYADMLETLATQLQVETDTESHYREE